MNKIAKTSPHTPFPTIEPATRFSEIRHGRQFAVDGASGVPAGIESIAGRLSGIFVLEPRVDVAD